MTIPWQPGSQGNMIVPATYTDPHDYSPALSGLQLVASTPLGGAGFALQNGTPTVISWYAPADNQQHRVLLIAAIRVTSNETGGQVNLNGTDPSGAGFSKSVLAAGLTTGYQNASPLNFIVGPGTTVTVAQGTALTLGAATLYAELWAC